MPSYFDTPPGYRPRDRRFTMQDDPRLLEEEARAAAAAARADAQARADTARADGQIQADEARATARSRGSEGTGRGVVKAADAPEPELKDKIGKVTDGIAKAAPPPPGADPLAASGGSRRGEALEGMSPDQKKRIWHPELFNPDGSEKVGAVPILAGGARGTIPPYTGPGADAVAAARTAGDEGRAIGDAARTDAMATADSARALGESARTDAMATADAARQAAGATGQWPEGTPPGQWQSTQSQAQSTRNVNTQGVDEMDEEERRRFLANQ